MSRSSALQRPPAPLPSAPAGEPETFVGRERRRGRGTLSNASGRYERVEIPRLYDGSVRVVADGKLRALGGRKCDRGLVHAQWFEDLRGQ